MFINFSNHPSDKWTDEQRNAAIAIGGEIVDLPFPNVDANADEEKVTQIASEYCLKIREMAGAQDCIVHVMGEMTLMYAVVSKLLAMKYVCVASTTERVVKDLPDGGKTSFFKFVKFRRYACL